jgi:hypothetical protein
MLGVHGVRTSGSLPFVARGHHWIVDSYQIMNNTNGNEE